MLTEHGPVGMVCKGEVFPPPSSLHHSQRSKKATALRGEIAIVSICQQKKEADTFGICTLAR